MARFTRLIYRWNRILCLSLLLALSYGWRDGADGRQ